MVPQFEKGFANSDEFEIWRDREIKCQKHKFKWMRLERASGCNGLMPGSSKLNGYLFSSILCIRPLPTEIDPERPSELRSDLRADRLMGE